MPLFKRYKPQVGFTLVELLVVIAILSILAVAGLATLNPAEILRKGRDSERLSTATDIVKAVERYNVSKVCNPWETTPGCTGTRPNGVAIDAASFATGGILEELIASQEVKASFVNKKAVQDGFLYITENATDGSVSICYEIESKQKRQELIDQNINNVPRVYGDILATGTARRCARPYNQDPGHVGRCYACVK